MSQIISLEETTPHLNTGKRIRLLSYNIQVGIGSVSYRHYVTAAWKHVLPHAQIYENLHNIAHAISGFDIVALQEVDAGSIRSSFINQAEYLAAHAGFPFWYHQTNRKIGNIARHSNGVLSKFKPSEVSDYKLPGFLPGRGVMVVRYGHPDNPLIMLIVHLALSKRARLRQLEFISEIVNCYEHVVVMGDLNCQPDSRELRHLLNTTNLCEPVHGLKTFPSWRPQRTIDHILASPSLEIYDVHVLDHLLSDHLPIAMEIQLPSGLELAA
ncbi:MAG: endonuclease/exonuclease/phosphatase family protein [Gammaproteobacteria bacterium]|nr:endonuclease/exonuclease/phosphatase family protein [Gammaproteobacteria bacterium]